MKNILIVILVLISSTLKAQNPTYKEKLYFTCKIYGFVKYYHSEVSTCKVNWDSIFLNHLPLIKTAVTKSDFNDQLNAILIAAGPMAKASGTLVDNIPSELKRNLDYTWTKDSSLRWDIRNALDTIKVHFRPHPSCWVLDNDYNGNYIGWLVFPNDSAMYKKNIVQDFPNEAIRLLCIFKYWNIIKYFNPYNEILDQTWETTFNSHILEIANATNASQYYFGIKHFASGLNDAHAEGLTSAFYISAPTYYYSPEIKLKYIENQYTVVASNITTIKKGSAITAINNIPVASMEDSLRPYISAGNEAVFHRTMCSYLLNGYSNTNIKISFLDSSGSAKSINTLRTTYIYEDFFFSYYPNDSLSKISYKKINCDIGYVNMGNLVSSEVSSMYQQFKNGKAIIFDIRNYPNGTAIDIANLMFPNKTVCAKFKIPNVNFPGTFYWNSYSFGNNNNANAYNGKVIILVNQETQSQAEYSAMILKAIPGAIIVGSQTAGADGNITYFNIARDLNAGFTTLGVYYPNGDSTQRIGIVPDKVVYPTRMGIMRNKDEVLEYALKQANCYGTGIDKIQRKNLSNIFPNPGTGIFVLETFNKVKQNMEIYDFNGKLVYSLIIDGATKLDLNWLNDGIYNIILSTSNTIETLKFVKIK